MLERVLPPGRPVRLGLPRVRTAADLHLAEDLIADAVDAGAISPGEARELQGVASHSWRARREAEAARSAREPLPTDTKELICKAAATFGMVWPGPPERGARGGL